MRICCSQGKILSTIKGQTNYEFTFFLCHVPETGDRKNTDMQENTWARLRDLHDILIYTLEANELKFEVRNEL